MGLTTYGHSAPLQPLKLTLRTSLQGSSPYESRTRSTILWLVLPCCFPSSLQIGGAGILNCYPSPTLFSLGLGPTNPTRTNLPSETLDIRRTRFSHVFCYSCRHSHFCRPKTVLSVSTVSPTERSPTTPYLFKSHKHCS